MVMNIKDKCDNDSCINNDDENIVKVEWNLYEVMENIGHGLPYNNYSMINKRDRDQCCTLICDI